MVKYFFFFLLFMMTNVSLCQNSDILGNNRLAITKALTTLNRSISQENNTLALDKKVKEIDRLFETRDSILKKYKDELAYLKAYLKDSTAVNKIEKDSSVYYEYANFLRQTHIEDLAKQKQPIIPSEQWAYNKYIREEINDYYKSKLQDSVSFASKSKKEYNQAYDKWQVELIFTDSLRLRYNSLKQTTVSENINTPEEKKVSAVPNTINNLQQRFEKIRRSIMSITGSTESDLNENVFEKKRGFHRWPVTEPQLMLRYGNQKDKESGSSYFNPGINIQSENDNLVKSIFEGTVAAKFKLDIDDYIIIIRHQNNYYSVYSGLSFSNANIDDNISTQQVIGLLPSSDSGYSMHLQLWENKKSINPIHWLKNRKR